MSYSKWAMVQVAIMGFGAMGGVYGIVLAATVIALLQCQVQVPR